VRVPLSWVAEFVDLGARSPEEIAQLLTLRTCEVEAVHRVGAGLEGIVVGEVVEAAKHPNADALRVTKVTVGRGELLPIVCGAPNVAAGQKVAVAVPGTRLPGGLEIGERTIRGEVSRGMILSERELGLGDEHDGILVLEREAKVGAPIVSLPSMADAVLEIDNKSVNHRPDLWGIYGFAGELSAILGRPLRDLEVAPYPVRPDEKLANPKTSRVVRSKGDESGRAKVAIEDLQGCSRYLAATFDGIEPGPSPAWMQRRLRLVGARPISNVVDVTNYVLFELGQPTHAFDAARVRGGKIVVRRARKGETLVTLDGQKRSLAPGDLLITDPEGPIGIAGVMGGADSEVRESTSAIVLESAAFDAASIRRTAARLGLRSEASARFEKTIDPESTDWALARIAFFAERGLLGPKVRLLAPVEIDGSRHHEVRRFDLSTDEIGGKLGLDAKESRAVASTWWDILRRLGFGVELHGDSTTATVTVPSHRATKDVTEPIDVVEEIARLRGYERVEPRPLVAPVTPPPAQGNRRLLIRAVEDRLVAVGFRGVETYSFLSDSLIEALGLPGPFVTVKNAMTVDQTRVRRSVLPSLLGLLARNLALEPELRLFEVGKGYLPDDREADPVRIPEPSLDRAEPGELHVVAGVIARPHDKEASSYRSDPLFEAKGCVETLLAAFGLEGIAGNVVLPVEGEEPWPNLPFIHPKRMKMFHVWVGKKRHPLGWAGTLHPKTAIALGIQHAEVAGFELDLQRLEAAVAEAGPKQLVPLPRYPGVTVDVALAAPDAMRVGDLEKLVREADPVLCRSVSLFDIYSGPELGEGRRSVAFRVELRSDERTLTRADEAGYLKKVADAARKAGATLRGFQQPPP